MWNLTKLQLGQAKLRCLVSDACVAGHGDLEPAAERHVRHSCAKTEGRPLLFRKLTVQGSTSRGAHLRPSASGRSRAA